MNEFLNNNNYNEPDNNYNNIKNVPLADNKRVFHCLENNDKRFSFALHLTKILKIELTSDRKHWGRFIPPRSLRTEKVEECPRNHPLLSIHFLFTYIHT